MVLSWLNASATHNRAGEITFRQVGKMTYEATLITYTDTRSWRADRPTITLKWGDGTESQITRLPQDQITLPNFTWKNIYRATHVYSGPGQYLLSFADPNRVADVINMDYSLGTQFYIESLLIIDPQQGFDQSPVLLNPPIDNACVNKIYTENPDAYDPDGDSLVYTLIPPKQSQGVDVAGYYTPKGFTLDRHSGQITWNVPKQIGIYNVAILIEEYRNKKRIGYILRDMQINVVDCNKNPPIITGLKDTCIEAGTNFNFILPVKATVKSVDPKAHDSVILIANGGPFLQKTSPAKMINNPARGIDSVKALFEWTVSCDHIRRQPYLVVFKAIDSDSLSDIANMQIRVVGPAPLLMTATPAGNSVILNWKKPVCPNPVGYFIYRRSDSTTWQHATCEIGVPGYTGYQLIDTITSPDITTFIDDNHGNSLSPGIRYCYVITAIYLNQDQFEIVEGYASNELCAQLKKDVPVMTHVSVRTTSSTNGSMYIDWSKPTEKALDTLQNPGPYMYKLYRSPGINTNAYVLLKTSNSNSFSGLNDTTYIDTMLNTAGTGYTYKVEFYVTGLLNGKTKLLGTTIPASSVYLNIGRGYKSLVLKWNLKVPWENSMYVVYRKNKITFKWDSIGISNNLTYIDSGRTNGVPECYYLRSVGSFRTPGFTDPLFDTSETMCNSPRDTVKPCPPLLLGQADCDSRSTQLNWTTTDSCTTKVNRYRIYYSTGNSYKFIDIDSVNGKQSGSFQDIRALLQHSLAGCYYVTAIDSYDNESRPSNFICVDNCPRYELPNVITPNGDNINDSLEPMKGYRFVESIDLRIYNRWGQEVFKTTDPAIRWDGVDEQSHMPLADGSYYYSCIVKEIYFDGIHERAIKGTVTILRHK
jgi:gliding motility-associated-like protein